MSWAEKTTCIERITFNISGLILGARLTIRRLGNSNQRAQKKRPNAAQKRKKETNPLRQSSQERALEENK